MLLVTVWRANKSQLHKMYRVAMQQGQVIKTSNIEFCYNIIVSANKKEIPAEIITEKIT